MQPRRFVGSALAVGAAVVTALAGVAGCSSGKAASPGGGGGPGGVVAPTPGPPDPVLASQVPNSYKARGSLSIAADTTYPPNEFVNGPGTIVGFDVDLGTALAAKLGLTAHFTSVTPAVIEGGVQGGTYDLSMASWTGDKDLATKLDLVPYLAAGTKIMVANGNPKNLAGGSATDPSACGARIGVEVGTVQQTDDIPARDKACEAAGKPDVVPVASADRNDLIASLQLGHSDAVLASSPVVDYYASRGMFTAVGGAYGNEPSAIIFSKNNHALAQLFAAALTDLKADGTYAKLAAVWGIS